MSHLELKTKLQKFDIKNAVSLPLNKNNNVPLIVNNNVIIIQNGL